MHSGRCFFLCICVYAAAYSTSLDCRDSLGGKLLLSMATDVGATQQVNLHPCCIEITTLSKMSPKLVSIQLDVHTVKTLVSSFNVIVVQCCQTCLTRAPLLHVSPLYTVGGDST